MAGCITFFLHVEKHEFVHGKIKDCSKKAGVMSFHAAS